MLHVVPSVALAPDVSAEQEFEDELLEQARAEAREAVEATQGKVTEFEAGFGDPDWLLHRRARELGCSLIVVGATHRGPLGRLVPGSLGERLVHGAPCAVVVVPEVRPPPCGGSSWPLTVARKASAPSPWPARRGRAHAELMLVAVEESDAGHRPRVPATCRWTRCANITAWPRSDWTCHRASCPPTMRVDTKVASGRTGPTLAAMCTQDTDLLVRLAGYGPLRGALLGSTSRHLVDHPPCPVLVVPRAAAARWSGRPPRGAPWPETVRCGRPGGRGRTSSSDTRTARSARCAGGAPACSRCSP